MEGENVICPWHSWAFHAKTGLAEYPEGQFVQVYPLKVEGEDVLVEIPCVGGESTRERWPLEIKVFVQRRRQSEVGCV